MRERCKIPACADTSTAWNNGIDPMIEQVTQTFRNHRTCSREALGQNVRAQQDKPARFLFRNRVSDTGSMAAYEVVLQLPELIVTDVDIGEFPETGRDA